MRRTLAIVVLTGLLLVSVGGNVLLLQQSATDAADNDHLRQRAVTAEQAQSGLDQRIADLTTENQRLQGLGSAGAGSASAPSPSANGSGPDVTTLQRIEDQVSQIRGLQKKTDVPLKLLSQGAMRQYFVDSFQRDYLPIERESDQKLLTILGLISPSDNLVDILVSLLQEQVTGVYDPDEKVMYLVGGQSQFDADAQVTFAHEFTHALQDQYFDLNVMAPKHPTNSDQDLAAHSVIEGDAVLVQSLWSDQYLTPTQLGQLGQGGSSTQLAQAPLVIRTEELFPYVAGLAFTSGLYQQGSSSFAAVDDAFRNPPDSTQQILQPQDYQAHKEPVSLDLPDLTTALGDGSREISSDTLGVVDMHVLIQQYADSATADRAIAGWNGDRWELLEKNGQQSLVLRSTWDRPEDAQAFFSAYSAGLQTRFGGAQTDDSSPTRQALSTASAATDLRISSQDVLAVLAPDRASADALVAAVGGF